MRTQLCVSRAMAGFTGQAWREGVSGRTAEGLTRGIQDTGDPSGWHGRGYDSLFCLAVRKLHIRGVAIFWGQGWWLSVRSQNQTPWSNLASLQQRLGYEPLLGNLRQASKFLWM